MASSRTSRILWHGAMLFTLSLSKPQMEAQTRQFLDAPVVNSQIKVRWNAGSKTMQYALDNDTVFRTVGQDTLFLAKRGVFVTYPTMNPLSIQATASSKAVADPGFTAVTKLIDAITGVANTVAPGTLASNSAAARLAPSGPCSDPATDIGNLVNSLYGSE